MRSSNSGLDQPNELGPTTREQRRSRRKRDVRACTISIKRMTQREVDSMRRTAPERDTLRPTQRSECIDGPRPCPFISCKYHLYLDVSPRTGSIKLNFPDLEVWEMSACCALDVADAGGTTLEDVGSIMNLTRERIRQLEVKALDRLEALADTRELRELCGIGLRRGAGFVRDYDFDQELTESAHEDDTEDSFD